MFASAFRLFLVAWLLELRRAFYSQSAIANLFVGSVKRSLRRPEPSAVRTEDSVGAHPVHYVNKGACVPYQPYETAHPPRPVFQQARYVSKSTVTKDRVKILSPRRVELRRGAHDVIARVNTKQASQVLSLKSSEKDCGTQTNRRIASEFCCRRQVWPDAIREGNKQNVRGCEHLTLRGAAA